MVSQSDQITVTKMRGDYGRRWDYAAYPSRGKKPHSALSEARMAILMRTWKVNGRQNQASD